MDRQSVGSFTETLLSPPNVMVLPPQSFKNPAPTPVTEPSVTAEVEAPAPQPAVVSIISPFSYFRRTESQQQLIDEKLSHSSAH